jgi:hypothetical protein
LCGSPRRKDYPLSQNRTKKDLNLAIQHREGRPSTEADRPRDDGTAIIVAHVPLADLQMPQQHKSSGSRHSQSH